LIRAAEYYKLSADQGNVHEQNNHDCCLEKGFRIAQDVIHAGEYYRL
jgi:hypothetical protein